jgi:hypothetical protein
MENQEELKMLKIYQNLGKSTFFRLNSTEHIPSPSSRPVLCSCYSKLIFVLPPLRDNFLRHLEDKIKSGHFSPRHLTRNQKRRTKCVKDSLARLKMEQIHEYPRENESFRQENSSLFGWKNLAENEEFKQNRDWPDLITNNFEVFICFVKCFSGACLMFAGGGSATSFSRTFGNLILFSFADCRANHVGCRWRCEVGRYSGVL